MPGMAWRTVLVVDDSDADLLYARVVLQQAGVAQQVLCLGTAQEALNHLQGSTTTDLVLLDLNMPEMDGFGFLSAYGERRTPGTATVPVVVLTSSPDPTDLRRATGDAGVVGYLVKPMTLADARRLPALAAAPRAPR
jgi:CheY-like chemotaxis protein